MAFRGIDIRETGDRILFRALITDSDNAAVATGTAALYLYELQNDGTLKSYDFDDNTFKTTALTTGTLALTHRTGNNSTVNTGLWTAILATLTGFTAGNIYIVNVIHSVEGQQSREFQFGSGVLADVKEIGGSAQSATDLKDLADTGYDPSTHKVQGVVLVDTTTTNTDMVSVAGLSTLTAAEVNAEVVDVINTDSTTAPTPGAPAATPSIRSILSYFYAAWRNKVTGTNALQTITNDAGTSLAKRTVSDDGTTLTKDEWVAP
jgi:hypothetical protein